MPKSSSGAGQRRKGSILVAATVNPATLLSKLLLSDPALRRKATFVFPLMPGARDVCIRFASYVGELPGPNASNLLTASVTAAFANIDSFGITPYTVGAHVDGFAAFCDGLLSYSAFLLTLRPVDATGRSWHPLQSPFAEWMSKAVAPVSIERREAAAMPAYMDSVLRVLILSKLLTRHDLPRLGVRWPDIARPSTC